MPASTDSPGGTVVLPHESQASYDSLRNSFVNRLRPSDETELDLIQEMVDSRWRLRRIEAMEAALIQKGINEQMDAMGEDADPRQPDSLPTPNWPRTRKDCASSTATPKTSAAATKRPSKSSWNCTVATSQPLRKSQQKGSRSPISVLRNEPGYRGDALWKRSSPTSKSRKRSWTRPLSETRFLNFVGYMILGSTTSHRSLSNAKSFPRRGPGRLRLS